MPAWSFVAFLGVVNLFPVQGREWELRRGRPETEGTTQVTTGLGAGLWQCWDRAVPLPFLWVLVMVDCWGQVPQEERNWPQIPVWFMCTMGCRRQWIHFFSPLVSRDYYLWSLASEKNFLSVPSGTHLEADLCPSGFKVGPTWLEGREPSLGVPSSEAGYASARRAGGQSVSLSWGCPWGCQRAKGWPVHPPSWAEGVSLTPSYGGSCLTCSFPNWISFLLHLGRLC